MPEHVHHLVKRLNPLYLHLFTGRDRHFRMTAFCHTSFSSSSSISFPLLTSFLMVFHITIACFMGMKYWSSKQHRTYSSLFRVCYSAADAWHAQRLSGLAYLQCSRSLIKMTPLSIISSAI